MSKGLFWAFFLFACVTSSFSKGPADVVPVSDEEQRLDRMFDSINRFRVQHRLPQVALDARLCQAGALHAEEMARHNFVSDHGAGIFPIRSSPGARAWKCGYAWSSIEEMVCGGSSDWATVLNLWLRSRAYARTLADPEYVDVGIGVARGPVRSYWVLVLARPSYADWPAKDFQAR